MAFFVMYKDWKNPVNRYYFIYNLFGFGILFTMFLTYGFPGTVDLTIINRITQGFTVMFFASLLVMSIVFPIREVPLSPSKALLIMLPAIIIAVAVMIPGFTINKAYFSESGKFIRDFNKWGYRGYTIIVGIYLLGGTINFIVKYFREKVEVYRLQMRYVFVGGSIALSFATFGSIILPVYANYSELYVIGPSIAAFIITMALFYTVINFNLMDISTVIHKTFMYTIISALIIVPIALILYFYYSIPFFQKKIPFYFPLALVLLFFFLFFTYVQPFIDKLFKRKLYIFENIVDDFIRNAVTMKDVNLIIEKTVEILVNSLYLNMGFFILMNNTNRKYELVSGKNISEDTIISLERNSILIRWFVRNQELLSIRRLYTDDKSFRGIRQELVDFYLSHQIEIIIPYYHERRLLGLLCLGQKESLGGFTPDEFDKLNYFQKESNGYISTALTYQKASHEQFVSRTLELSSNILAHSVPTKLPKVKGLQLGAFYIPGFEEGIDYFDYIQPVEDGIGMIATNVSGVGINTALYSVLMRSTFQSLFYDAPSTSAVMQNLNSVLFKYSKGKGGLVTAFYLYYDVKSMRLMYSNAGFPALDIFRVDKGDFDSMDTEGIPLGYDDTSHFGRGRTDLTRGDIGILYSKTIINSRNQNGEDFGLIRMRNIVRENRGRKPEDIAQIVFKHYQKFLGLSSPNSDVLMIIFKVV